MSVLTRNNVTLAGRADPGARTMLFAHGYGCDQHMWRFITPAFADDYRARPLRPRRGRALRPDRLRPAKYSSLQGIRRRPVRDLRRARPARRVFVGHSVQRDDWRRWRPSTEPERFDRLILIGPRRATSTMTATRGGFSREDIAGLLEFQDSNYLGWSRTMAPVIMGNPDRPELGEELTNSFCRTDPEIAKQFAAVTFLSDNRADLPKVQHTVAHHSVARGRHRAASGGRVRPRPPAATASW